jgi:HTH-type transcriptional regulator/antitoxin HigA
MEMNARELSASWQNFQQAFGIVGPIRDEAHYEQILEVTGELMDELSVNEASPVASLVELLADRIREYESRVHPWPDTATPAEVLRFLMDQHGLKQAGLAAIGSQGVVSEILKGKRELNVRQIAELSRLFNVSPAVFFPSLNDERFALAA